MDNKKVIQLYEGVEKNIKKISDNAYKAFKERDEAIQSVDSTLSMFGSFGLSSGYSSYDLKKSGVNELQKDMKTFASQIKKEIEKIQKELERLFDSAEDIEAIHYLIDGLSKLALYTERLDYTVAGMGTYGGCHCIVVDAHKTWKEKVENDKELHKRGLQQTIVRNEKMIKEEEIKASETRKKIANLQEELVSLMQNYVSGIQGSMEKTSKRYSELLSGIETEEQNICKENQELLEWIKKRNTSSGRKKKEAQHYVTQKEDNIKNSEKNIEKYQLQLKEISMYAMEDIKKYDKVIDEKRKSILCAQETLELSLSVINNCAENIERIKGELNV